MPEGVSHAGNNRSAICCALFRNMGSPDRSYALSNPPKTLQRIELLSVKSVKSTRMGNIISTICSLKWVPDGGLENAGFDIFVEIEILRNPAARRESHFQKLELVYKQNENVKVTYSRAFSNCFLKPMMYKVSKESIMEAPRPANWFTPTFDCGCTQNVLSQWPL